VDPITKKEMRKWCREHSPQMSNAYDCFPVSMPCLHRHQELSDGPYHVCKDCGMEVPQ